MLVHSGAANQTIGQRVSTTCLFSRDGGKSWTDPTVVLPRLDANGAVQHGEYSAVQALSNTEVGVVLEAQQMHGSHMPSTVLGFELTFALTRTKGAIGMHDVAEVNARTHVCDPIACCSGVASLTIACCSDVTPLTVAP